MRVLGLAVLIGQVRRDERIGALLVLLLGFGQIAQ